VSYVGHGIHDDAEYPPSVVVSELLDVLDESFRVPEGSVRSRVVVHHPLQPFSRRYFEKGGDARLFSYDPAYHEGASGLGGERIGRPPFLRRPLAPDPAAKPVVTIDELARFFENPARGFVRRRLGLYVEDDGPEVDFRDPIAPNNLVQWKVAMELIGCEVGGSGSSPRSGRGE
jgi:exodeoxyribonuclease V gamma subunit